MGGAEAAGGGAQRRRDGRRPRLRARLRHAGRRDERPVRGELRQPRHGAGGRGAYLLPRIVGQSTAMELLASGRIIDATRAREIGLVDEVCAPGDLMARATELAERLAPGPVATFAALKQVVRLTAA